MASNALSLLAAQIVALGAGMAVVIAISRLLGADGLGQWRFAQAVAAYVMVIGDAGLGTLATREIARDRSWLLKYAASVIAVRSALTMVLLLVVTGALAAVAAQFSTIIIVVVVGMTAVANSASAAPLLQGLEQIRPTSRLRMVTQTVAGLTAVALAVGTGNLVLVMVPLAIAPAVVATMTLRWAAEQGAFKRPFRVMALSGPLIRAGWRFLAAAIAIQLLFNADALIMQFARGSLELGLYAGPYALASYLMIVGASVTQAAYPRLASHAQGTSGSSLLLGILSLMGFIGLPLAIGGAILSGQIVLLLFGPAYSDEGTLFSLLLAFAALGFFNLTMGQALMASGHEHDAMMVAVASAVLNVGLNIVAIPAFGRMGAASAVVASECSSVVLYCIYARNVSWTQLIGRYASSLPHALVMGVAVLAAHLIGLPVLVSVAVGMITYAIANLLAPSPGMRILLDLLVGGGPLQAESPSPDSLDS